MSKIVIANMMRCKNKQSFFALHQIQTKLLDVDPTIDVEFHIIWDSDPTHHEKQDEPKWVELIDTHIKNIHSYDRQFFKEYIRTAYEEVNTDQFDVWPPIYLILIAHYLRRVKLYDYYLMYDDDVVINYDFADMAHLMVNKVPVLISEPMNSNCDKVMFQSLIGIFGNEFVDRYKDRNPMMLGFNAGFQGIDLSIYDSFLSSDRFMQLLSLIQFKSIYTETGEEIWGNERFFIDTQQQSLCSLMNVVLTKTNPHILNPEEYYVVPNFGHHPKFGALNPEGELDGWGPCLKSKISHFIGHTRGKGKPRMLLQLVDKYLTEQGFLNE